MGKRQVSASRLLGVLILAAFCALATEAPAARTYATVKKTVYVITKWSDLNDLASKAAGRRDTGKEKSAPGKTRKTVKVELVRVIPKRGNNPFYQPDPVRNTYNPLTGAVVRRYADEPVSSGTDTSNQSGTGGQPGGQPDAQCSLDNLAACRAANLPTSYETPSYETSIYGDYGSMAIRYLDAVPAIQVLLDDAATGFPDSLGDFQFFVQGAPGSLELWMQKLPPETVLQETFDMPPELLVSLDEITAAHAACSDTRDDIYTHTKNLSLDLRERGGRSWRLDMVADVTVACLAGSETYFIKGYKITVNSFAPRSP